MDDRYKDIVSRAAEVFMKYGIRSVSMDDVCKDLVISKKTLYQYFSNKQELLESVLDALLDIFYDEVQKIRDKNNNAIDDLLEISILISTSMNDIHPSVTFDLQKYYPGLYKQAREKRRKFTFQYIHDNIVKGISEGVYREDLNTDLVATLYINKLEDLHDPEYHEAEAISFELIFEVMFENHIRGISNGKGIAYFEDRKKDLNLKISIKP